MSQEQHKIEKAIKAARLYYYQNMTTTAIAKELHVSASTVSRLLSYAKDNGLVQIRIIDPTDEPNRLAQALTQRYAIEQAHVVPVAEVASESEWLARVAGYTVNYLNRRFESNQILGIAWGTTLSSISRQLRRKNTFNSHIVQLNGAGNTFSTNIEYASQILTRFAENYQARAHLFPVPTFFDYPATKQAMWKEGSIQHILALQEQADWLLYSIGAVNAGIPSHVYSGGYLNQDDYQELERHNIAGDIATVFFREDGSFDQIPLNQRSSGPNLALFKEKHGICVVSGLAKVRGIHAAMTGHLLKELIIDEPTARALLERYA